MTMFGGNYYYECPKCKNVIYKPFLMSGNTSGAKLYSDGKFIAPMLPEFPLVSICSKCNTIFWIDKPNIRASEFFKDKKDYNKELSEQARFLSVYELFTAIENNIHESENDELYLRERILWAFNDRIRNSEALFSSEADKVLWEINLNRLLALLDKDLENHKLLIAEIYRYRGDFNKCIDIVSSVNNPEYTLKKELIIEECNNENISVFLFKHKE